MRKRSISDQCLVARDISFHFKQNIKKSKSEEQLKLFKHGQNNQADSKRRQIINFVKPASIFRIKKNKNNYKNLPVKFKTVNETAGKQKNQQSLKKKSVVLQAAALLQVDNYSELNERIEFLKVSMMNNLNKLLERDVSLMDLERKADNLTADALNLKMTSNKVKKIKTYKKFRKKILICLIVFIVVVCLYCCFLLMFSFNNHDINSKNVPE